MSRPPLDNKKTMTQQTADDQHHRALSKREDFADWKQRMQMIALSKCDGFERIFFNAGTTPIEQAEYTALTVANRGAAVASSTACKVASTQSSTHITVGSGGTRSARCVSLCDVRRVSCLCGSGTITKALWCRCESGQREWGCCSHEERAHEEHSPLLDHGWP